MLEERKLVTVLFADVIGSTALSEGLDPERLRTVLDAYFKAMAEVIAVWGGTVEKYIGDAVVAVFGVPTVREDDAERGLRAALGMLTRLEQLNGQLQKAHGVSLQIRIGVNTGEVLAATQNGLDQRLVAGDAVNVAARLQAAAEPGTVLVGERTSLMAQRSFTFAEPVALTVKGKGQPIRTRRLIGALAEGRTGVEGLRAPMVGRQTELQLLVSVLDDVMSSRSPRLVTVTGQAGVGKSRLVAEFASLAVGRTQQARRLRGRCLAAGQGITYWALAEILRSACRISLDDPVDVSQQKLQEAIGGPLRAAGVSGPEVEQTIFALAMTAGISLPGNTLVSLEPEAVADELGRAWPRFMSALAAGGLAILIVEDLHWAGEPLVKMVERIVTRSTGPLLVVATARPEFAEKFPQFGGGSDDFSTIRLRALSDRQTQELVDALLQVAELPGEVRAAILARAEGNPLFVEEILQRLIEAGGLVRDGPRWVATQSASQASLPETLHALIAARIDALDPREKRVLQEAAIVGKVFWEQPLTRMTGLPDVHRALLELERRGLVLASLTTSLAGQPEYSFKHVLLKDVAYAGVPKARRARAHAETADWIAELAGDRKEEFAELLAYHYEAAAGSDGADLAWEDPAEREAVRQKAFDYLVLAGAGARQRYLVSKAVELHERALALARDDGERERALEQVGDDHDSAYHGDSAIAAFERALALLPATEGSAQDRTRLYWKMAWLMAFSPGAFTRSPDGATVEELIAAGMASARDQLSRGRLLVAKGAVARLWSGSEPFGQGLSGTDPVPVEERIRFAEEGLAIGRSLGDRGLITLANRALAVLYGAAGRHREALSLARTWLEQSGPESRIEQADVLRTVAWFEMMVAGDFEGGLAMAGRSHELSQGSNPHQVMHATAVILVGLFELGRWREMTPFLEEHLTAFREDPAVLCSHVRAGPVIGATLLTHTGRVGRARELAAMVGNPQDDPASASAWQARYAIASGDPQTGWEISRTKALERRSYGPEHAQQAVEALVALRNWDELADFLPRVREQIAGNVLLAPVCDRADGLMAAATGDAAKAQPALRRALATFEALGAGFEVARTQDYLAAVVGGQEGRVLREAARAAYERLGAAPHVERLAITLSQGLERT
jgi:class 3 adenylate cyclase/tetratricopeptide (TPR) repeat protein